MLPLLLVTFFSSIIVITVIGIIRILVIAGKGDRTAASSAPSQSFAGGSTSFGLLLVHRSPPSLDG